MRTDQTRSEETVDEDEETGEMRMREDGGR